VGVDGGGTKTQAVILDANFAILGEVSPPLNPLRVGIANAAVAFAKQSTAPVKRRNWAHRSGGAEDRPGRARRKELSMRMREALLVGNREVMVVVTPTSRSMARRKRARAHRHRRHRLDLLGINARGKQICAAVGDRLPETKRRRLDCAASLRAIAHAVDGRGPSTSLTVAACTYFHVSDQHLQLRFYSPTITNERLAVC